MDARRARAAAAYILMHYFSRDKKQKVQMDTESHCRHRKILTLKERVQVIRLFEKCPNYNTIAKKFDCSVMQIIRIVTKRAEILKNYAKSQSIVSSSDEAERIKLEKIEFLDKVIYEFVERAVYHNVKIDLQLIQKMALQVGEAIALSRFAPDSYWQKNFKTNYKITNFDLESLRNSIKYINPKESSFKCNDIIQYIIKLEKAQREQQHRKQTQINIGDVVVVSSNTSMLKYEIDIDDRQYSDAAPNRPSANLVPHVANSQDAMVYLKAIEEYAMLSDNYRAIGLITQLEEAFTKGD